MIHIDLTNDAPVVEYLEGTSNGSVMHITTSCPAGEEDRVTHTTLDSPAQDPWEVIPVVAVAKVNSNRILERDLPNFGLYHVDCWTRRGQARTYCFELEPILGDDTHCTLTIDHVAGPPVSWVTADEVYTLRNEESLDIILSLQE